MSLGLPARESDGPASEILFAPSEGRPIRDIVASWSEVGKLSRMCRDGPAAVEVVAFPVDGPASAINQGNKLNASHTSVWQTVVWGTELERRVWGEEEQG